VLKRRRGAVGAGTPPLEAGRLPPGCWWVLLLLEMRSSRDMSRASAMLSVSLFSGGGGGRGREMSRDDRQPSCVRGLLPDVSCWKEWAPWLQLGLVFFFREPGSPAQLQLPPRFLFVFPVPPHTIAAADWRRGAEEISLTDGSQSDRRFDSI